MNVIKTTKYAGFLRPGINFLLILLCSTMIIGCNPRSCIFQPQICYTPNQNQLKYQESAFEPLSSDEISQEWGKELKIAISLAREGDLYRSITAFKRARILMPEEEKDRYLQAEFSILQCYWQGRHYCEAIETFENSPLHTVSSKFPPFREMLVILFQCYHQTEQDEKAEAVLSLMHKGDPETALRLKIFTALDTGNIYTAHVYSKGREDFDEIDRLLQCYCNYAKSVSKAQTLNAILPGAGYYYVGQKKTALTSFLINAAFTTAAYYFYKEGNWGAAVITTSLEFGWYFGGINGAGLAAKEWNERLYEDLGKEVMVQQKYFPILMLETSF